jgi:capsular polysaccharide biosynthesis protein
MARLHGLAGAAWTALALILSQNAFGDGGSSGQSGSSLPALLVEHQLLQARYNQVTDQINKQAQDVQSLERFNGDADQLRTELDELKGIAKDMGLTLQKRKIELDAAPRVSIYQGGMTPELVGTARPYVAAGVGALVGLLLVIGTIVLFLVFRRKPSAGPGKAETVRSGRWIKWAFLTCLALIVAGGLGALGWFLFPAKYESAGYVRVSVIDPAVWQSRSGTDFESYKRNMIETVKSPVILGKAVEDTSIQRFPLYRKNMADPVDWLSDTLEVSGGNGELIRISLRNEDPQGVKEIVDAVLGAFKDEVIERARSEKLNDVDSLERKVKSYQTQILDNEKALYNLSQQLGTRDSQVAKVQYRMQVDSLDTLLRMRSDLQRQIADIEFKMALTKLMRDLDEKGIVNPAPDKKPEKAVDNRSQTPPAQKADNERSDTVPPGVDDPFAPPPAKKADAKPTVTDPFADLLDKDSNATAKNGKKSVNPFEEKEPRQSGDAKPPADIKP